ncbi:hypothetical protein D3C85_1107330 [compost metagenome]
MKPVQAKPLCGQIHKLAGCVGVDHAHQGACRITAFLLNAGRTGGMPGSGKLQRHRARTHEHIDVVERRGCEAGVADRDTRPWDRLRNTIDDHVVAVVRGQFQLGCAVHREPALTVANLR